MVKHSGVHGAYWLGFAVLWVSIACGLSEVQGQDNPGRKNDLRVIDFSGKIEGHGQGALQVVNDKGEKKIILLPDNMEKIAFTAEALPEWIQQGALVRFAAEFNADGTPKEGLTELEVFIPNARRRRPFSPEEMQHNVPGIYPLGVGKGTNLADAGASAVPTSQKFNVVGMIIGMEKGAVGLQCGAQVLKMPLDEKCKFTVTAHGLDLAAIGDAINVKGLYSPKQSEQIQADHVSVTAAKPMGSVEEDSAKQAPSSKKSKSKNAKKSKAKTPRQFDDY